MREVIVNIDKETELVVTGILIKGEHDNNVGYSFQLSNIQVYKAPDNDISSLLEWANSLKSGTVLEEIEQKVLEVIKNS